MCCSGNFILCAGMRHSPPSRSNSDHSAFAQFARPDEHKRREFQSCLGRRLPAVSVDSSKQLTNAFRIRDRGMVTNHDRRECAFEVCRRIALRTTCRDGVAEHLACTLLRTVRGLVFPSRLQLPKRCKEFRRCDVPKRPRADVRVEQLVKCPFSFLQRGR